jgi:hypothetical protein
MSIKEIEDRLEKRFAELSEDERRVFVATLKGISETLKNRISELEKQNASR